VLLSGLPLSAQDEPESAMPAPARSSIQWSIGFGAFSSPRPYVGAKNSRMVAPLLELSYKRFYIQGIQAGYRLFDTEDVSFHARAGVVFAGLDPDDSQFLEGMSKRKSTIEGGFVFDWKPGAYRLSTSAFTDLLGRSNGQQVAADFSRTWTFRRYRWGFTPSIGLVWQSSNYVDYYYGVTPDESRPGRPPFRGHSVVNFRSSLFGFYRLGMRTQLVGLIRIQRLANEIYESPIVDRRRGIFALAGVTYRFGKMPPSPQ
jgi:outer membrane protein